MSERFGARAVALCGQAALVAGWRPAEFWAATPAELEAVLLGLSGAAGGGAAAGAREIARLQEMFPDG